ncbi:MAG: hydrogenase maturation protease [Chloroflexi bacterium]|nr:hydrogenase maturation protease [Chloroflexota bacterium]
MNESFSTTDRCGVLVVGLGNPLLGDDGVGWRVAEQVQRDLESVVEIDCLAVGGLRLMERLVGYEHAILVDAMTTRRQPPGTVCSFSIDDLPAPVAGHLSSVHDTSLQTALRLGRALGLPLPDDIWVVGVEAERTRDFAEELTPPVAAAVPYATRMVIERLRQLIQEEQQL